MKNVVRNEVLKKNNKKEFIKKETSNIISENYNPLNAKDKIYEREGLYVELINNELLKEVMDELNFIERIFFKRKFIKVYKNGVKEGFNWSNSVR